MPGTKYKLVFLDADDTLFDYTQAESFALKRAFSLLGAGADLALNGDIFKSYGEINKKLWRDYENKLINQDLLRTERFRLLFEKHGIDGNEHEFSAEYLRALAQASFLVEGAESLCEYLHSRYTVAIITNGIAEVQRSRLAASLIKNLIDHLIISEEAGCSKPDPGIFSYAEKITGIRDKAEMIIVGDSPQSDIQGGINYGIDTCWFNMRAIENNTGIEANHTIGKLAELKAVLERRE